MSELTKCNYCSIKEIRERAKRKGWKVTTNKGWNNGVNVYVHPKGIKFSELSDDEKYNHRVCWFQRLPDHCCC